MFLRQRSYWLLVILGAFLLIAGALQVMAQAPATEVEVVGAIEAMGTNTLTINGLTIDISSAEINTSLQLDQTVKVEGTLNVDGSITARQVNAFVQGVMPGEAEFVAAVESFNGTTLVVSGITFDVSGAEITGEIVIGAMVKVHARLLASGTWAAREIELFVEDDAPEATPEPEATAEPGDDGKFEITGTLQSVGDGFIVVSGQTIGTAGAEIKDPLVPGTLVKVHLSLVDGQFVAREVENAHEDDDDFVFDCTLPPGWTTYTVQPDDTLSGIAVRSDSSVGELAAANCLTSTGLIVTGSTLFVPETPAPSFDNANDNGDDNNDNDDNDNGDDDNANDNHDDDGNDNHDDDNANDNGDDHGGDDSSGNSGRGGGDD